MRHVVHLFASNTYLLWSATTAFAGQIPLTFDDAPHKVPGGSMVQLCPGSHANDIFEISSIVQRPQKPYLDDGIEVLVYGNMRRNISIDAPVEWQLNATANTGESAEYKREYRICDWVEGMHQPPDWDDDKACPPKEGPLIIDFMAWLAPFLVAPGLWSMRIDAKTLDGEPIYCIQGFLDLQCPPWHKGPECLREYLPELPPPQIPPYHPPSNIEQ